MQVFIKTVHQQQEGSFFKRLCISAKSMGQVLRFPLGKLGFDLIWSCSLPGAAGKSPKHSVFHRFLYVA